MSSWTCSILSSLTIYPCFGFHLQCVPKSLKVDGSLKFMSLKLLILEEGL